MQYNERFRRQFWSELGQLSLRERREILTLDAPSHHLSKVLLHSVRSLDELEQVTKLLPDWGFLQLHIEYIRRQIAWENGPAAERIWNAVHQPDQS